MVVRRKRRALEAGEAEDPNTATRHTTMNMIQTEI